MTTANLNSIDIPAKPPIGGLVLVGLFLVGSFFGGFVFWAATAPLQSAAIASGSVNLDTYRKTVQHLEGGIVAEILVREGQSVEKDETLLILDQTRERAQINLVKARMSAGSQQLELLEEELADAEQLLEQGLTRKTRVLELRRRHAELIGNQIQSEAELEAAQHVIERSTIKAPIAGTVVGLEIHTRGGVIQPGAELMSIIPQDEPLVIEAQLDPNDIDIVQQGMDARVVLTPYNTRDVPPLKGQVMWVSADLITSPDGQNRYYLARVELEQDGAELSSAVDLYPGMPAEVMIVTGERTLVNYLAAPLVRSFRRAFRES